MQSLNLFMNKRFRFIVSLLICLSLFLCMAAPVQAATKKINKPQITSAKYVSSSDSITIKWKKVSNAKKYEIYRSKNSSAYKKIATTTKLTFKDLKFSSNNIYKYKIKAVNGKTKSKYSKVKTVSTKLGIPEIKTIKYYQSGDYILLKWNKVKNAKEYNIYISINGGEYLYWATSSKASFKNYEPLKATTFKFKVQAVNGSLESKFSKAKKVKVPAESKYEPKIDYIIDRTVQYDADKQEYHVIFGFLCDDETTVKTASGLANISIKNENGENVYNESISFDSNDFYLTSGGDYPNVKKCWISIPTSVIKKTKVSTGKLTLGVSLNNGVYWSDCEMDVNNLPVYSPEELVKVSLPETPFVWTDYYSNTLADEQYSITDISYSVKEKYDGTYNVTLMFSGKKVYDRDGDNISSNESITVKIYSGDTVIDSGSFLLPSLCVGEGFSNVEKNFYGLSEGEYVVKILDKE